MQIRLLTSLVGMHGQWAPGDLYDCDEGTAARLIKAGAAVPIEIGGVELAVTYGPPETAVKRKGRKRG